jgi:4-hydroxybenzoate polyprenyltransferase
LFRRLWEYQRERFPLAAYAPLVAAFTFSAAAYSRVLRGASGAVPAAPLAVGTFTALVFFFLLRVLDEHKDAETDRRYRPELSVPRGLVSLAELRLVGGAALGLAVLLNALVVPALLPTCLVLAVWTTLMTREFFVGKWLRAHPTAYMLSHMLVMPLIDAYTTGLDWTVARAQPEPGLWFFLVVTFLNGTLMEVGRKTRAPEDEREGVDTYSKAWGQYGAPRVWLGVLALAAGTTWLAARSAGAGWITAVLLGALLALTAHPAIRFQRTPTHKNAEGLATASGLWTLAVYLLLGAGPFVARMLAR